MFWYVSTPIPCVKKSSAITSEVIVNATTEAEMKAV